jgi:[ribosomal protein S5]-alanine N-acetyltransferase
VRGIKIQTKRLLLRPFIEEDVDEGLAYRNDESFVRFLPNSPYPFTRKHAEDWVALNMNEPWDKFPTFAIVFESRLVGDINLTIDIKTSVAMLGYSVGRDWWGKGIAVEAARAVMGWGLNTLGLMRIWASTDANNVQSRRVLEKLGMNQETIKAGDHRGRQGELVDEVVYGFNASDESREAYPRPDA